MSTTVSPRQAQVVPIIDKAAAAFADQHGLWPDLDLAVELLHDAHPGLMAVQVSHVIDPESTDYEYLRVESRAAGDLEEILDHEDQFCAALCGRMDAERRCFFAFTVIII
ncbi:MAG TPA: hypothetical protein VNE39_11760 [Planctomycetota bacterium]|nr:hypothetical protein [Planctomycetota bacterium]